MIYATVADALVALGQVVAILVAAAALGTALAAFRSGATKRDMSAAVATLDLAGKRIELLQAENQRLHDDQVTLTASFDQCKDRLTYVEQNVMGPEAVSKLMNSMVAAIKASNP